MVIKCQHEGCNRTTVVECIKPELAEYPGDLHALEEEARRELLAQYIEYYCPEHCQAHGYCWNCGFHQADPANFSIEGLCPNCEGKLELG